MSAMSTQVLLLDGADGITENRAQETQSRPFVPEPPEKCGELVDMMSLMHPCFPGDDGFHTSRNVPLP